MNKKEETKKEKEKKCNRGKRKTVTQKERNMEFDKQRKSKIWIQANKSKTK